MTEDEIAEVARQFPTHLGEPAVSVLIQRMVSEVRERRAADRPSTSWRDAYSKTHVAVGELLTLARSSRRDAAAIDAAEHMARAVLAALQGLVKLIDAKAET